MESADLAACWSTCWDRTRRYPGGLTGQLLADLGLGLALLAVDAATGLSLRRQPPRSPSAAPSFGVGGAHILRLVCRVGAVAALTEAFNYAALYPFRDHDVSCLVQDHSGVGFPLLPALCAYFAALMLAGLPLRKRARHGWARALAPARDEAVMLLPNFRGIFANALALQGARVVGYDAYDPADPAQAANRAWALENAEREGVGGRVSVRHARVQATAAGLRAELRDGADGEFDTLVLSFFGSHPAVADGSFSGDEAAAARRLARQRQLLVACLRLLRPGGRVVATDVMGGWKASLRAMELTGLEGAALAPGTLWFGLMPCRQVVARRPSDPGWRPTPPAAGEASGAGEAAGDSVPLLSGPDTGPEPDDGSGADLSPLQTPAVAVMLLTFLLLYAGCMALTVAAWCDSLRPAHLPWNNQYSSLLASVVNFLPLSMYTASLELAVDVRRPAAGLGFLLGLAARATAEVVLDLTLFNFVFWLPSFAVDLALYGRAGDGTLTMVNIAVNVFTAFAAASVARAVAQCRKRNKCC